MKNDFYVPDLSYLNAVLYVICVFGVISQVLLLVAFIKNPLKCFKNSGTYLVGNLAVSDMLTCLSPLVGNSTPSERYHILLFIFWCSVHVSILSIASLAFNRFLMIAYPLEFRVLMKGKILTAWLVCMWLLGSAFPTKHFLLSIPNDKDHVIVNIFEISVIMLASVMYGFAYRRLQKQTENFALENVSDRQQHVRVTKEKRFLRTIILLTCIAIVCTVPSSIFYHHSIPQYLSIHHEGARVLTAMFSCLFFTNYAVNPLVYVLRLPSYRKTFYVLYCCKVTRR